MVLRIYNTSCTRRKPRASFLADAFAANNKDNKLTPRDFRSPAGVRVLRFEF